MENDFLSLKIKPTTPAMLFEATPIYFPFVLCSTFASELFLPPPLLSSSLWNESLCRNGFVVDKSEFFKTIKMPHQNY